MDLLTGIAVLNGFLSAAARTTEMLERMQREGREEATAEEWQQIDDARATAWARFEDARPGE